jgi:hypothetical protein
VQEPIVFDCHFALGLRTMSVIRFFRGELMQCLEIIDLTFQFLKRVDYRAQARDFIHIGLGALAIVPKIRRRHSRLERD